MANRYVFETGLDASGYAAGLRDMEVLSSAAGKRMASAMSSPLSHTTAGFSTGIGSSTGHGGRGGVIGEAMVLARELGRQNYARVPGSLTILAQRMGALKYIVKDATLAEELHAEAMTKAAITAEAEAVVLAHNAAAARIAMEAKVGATAAEKANVAALELEALAAQKNAIALDANAVVAQKLAVAKRTLAGAAKMALTPLGLIAIAVLAIGAAAFYTWKHFKALNEQFDRTAAEAAKPVFADRSKAMEAAARRAADATADLIDQDRKLANSRETIAEKTSAVIRALTEEYSLKQQLAKAQGADQRTLDAMEQEGRQKKIDALNEAIAAARAQLEKDRAARDAAADSAFRGPDAQRRSADLKDIPENEERYKKRLEELGKIQAELQEKAAKATEKDLRAAKANLDNKVFWADSQRVFDNYFKQYTASNAARNFPVGPKGQEQQRNLDDVNSEIAKYNDLISQGKKNLPLLSLAQREAESTSKDAAAALDKTSGGIDSMTKELGGLQSDFSLHAKYNPLLEAAQKSKGAAKGPASGGADALVRVGNFLGSSRGQIETLAQEGNRIAREHLGVARQTLAAVRQPKTAGANSFPIH